MNTAEETRPCVNCGEYRLEREIGRGAYGVVYLAEGPNGDLVAVKVCRREDIGEERYERELRGAKLYSAIPPQEGLVPMFEIVEEPWGFYAVMGLADDEFGRESMEVDSYRPKTLASVISGEKALSLKECVEIGITLAKGLAALQRHHLLHRDIKPGNVLFFEGRPVLSDPGLVVEESNAVSSVGTPGYLPPERKFTGPTSDIYCLGLTLKAASFGRQVEDLDRGPAPEADTGAALFLSWWRILDKATEESLALRYQSAKALIKDIMALGRKMEIAATKKIWIVRTTIALLLALVAFNYMHYHMHYRKKKVVPSVAPLTDFRTGVEKSNKEIDRETERIERDSFWNSYSRSINAYTDGISDNERLEKKIERDIAEIRVINNANADQLQESLENIVAIAAKEEDLDKKIDALREKAKAKTGRDDADEYRLAKKLHEDRTELHEKMQNVVANLNTAETNILERINRDWFWDLHNSRTCSLNSEFIRDCIKRSIAVTEASDTRSEYYRNISINSHREHFERFIKEEEIHALARQQFARLMKSSDEKTKNGLDDSAELLQMRDFFGGFYYNYLVNAMHPSWFLKTSFNDRVKFDYKYYDARNFSLRLESYIDLFRREISIIAEADKTLGEQLQRGFERLVEHLAKEAAYQRDIDVLYEKAREKRGMGLDDVEEFSQAQKIANEAIAFHKDELNPLADELYNRMMKYERKHEKTRWDGLYSCRHYSLDVELARQGIAEVSRFSEEIAAILQTELDGLVKGNAKAAPLQREIDLLRKQAKVKQRNWQDDSEEYRRAKEIHEKEWDLYNHEIAYQVELDSLKSLISDVWHRFVTPDRWADKSRNGLWRIERRKVRKGK